MEQKVPTVPAFLPMESAAVPALPLPLCSSLPSHPSFLHLSRPPPRESKRGEGYVVFVVILRGRWFVRICSKRLEERYRACRIYYYFKGSLI